MALSKNTLQLVSSHALRANSSTVGHSQALADKKTVGSTHLTWRLKVGNAFLFVVLSFALCYSTYTPKTAAVAAVVLATRT